MLASSVSHAEIDGWQRVFCATFRSPKGNLTIAIVNDAPSEFSLKLAVSGSAPTAPFYRYRYTEAERDRADVKINPQGKFLPTVAGAALRDKLPPNSLTIYSTYQVEHGSPGIMQEPTTLLLNADQTSKVGTALGDRLPTIARMCKTAFA